LLKTDWRGEEIVDHKLEGLEDFMKNSELTKVDSILIWNILLHTIQQKDKEDLFAGYYSWYYYSPHKTTFKSAALKLLQEKDWLYSKEGKEKFKPKELTLEALDKEYNTDSEEAEKLIDKLNFLSSAEDEFLNNLPETKREMYNQFEEVIKLCEEEGIDFKTALRQIKDEAQAKKEQQEMEETPDIDSIDISESGFEGSNNNKELGTLSFSNSEDKGVDDDENEENDNNGNKGKQKKRARQSQKMRNFIGNQGEKVVFKYLKIKWSKNNKLLSEDDNTLKFQNQNKEIIIVEWLNSETQKGFGCDFWVKKNDEIIEYIEVKSTKEKGKDLYPVNGFQWSSAYKLYKEGRGNTFYFYIVRNALTEKPTVTVIRNPIKLWKDGKLHAHPVNLEL
jgi:hypothetical protein